jgi:cytochrome c oxidase subunit 2
MRWLIPVLLGICLLFVAGCGLGNSNILDPQGPVALSESNLFWFILIVAAVVFFLVEAILIYSVIRFRARPDSPEPRQIHGNTKLEIWWTIVPSLVLFLVLALTVKALFSIQEPASNPNNPTMYVNVFGHQWWWEFRYFDNESDALANADNVVNNTNPDSPQPTVITADELVVPKGTTVHLNLVSDNVIHSFWIPQLTGKTDVIPGHANHMWFQADTLGTYQGACAEFCGDQHAHMRFEVVVKNMNGADSFESWMTAQQAPAYDPASTLPAGTPKPTCADGDPHSSNQAFEGKYLFYCATFANNTACIQCHSVFGSDYGGIKAQGVVGPNLTHFGSRDLIAGGVLQNCPGQQNCATLAQWLTNPQSVKPGNDMPDLGLAPDQVQALVAYLESLQ